MSSPLSSAQKDWLGKIKEKIKGKGFLDIKEYPKKGHYVSFYFGGENRDECKSGFSYDLNSEEDFSIIMSSIT